MWPAITKRHADGQVVVGDVGQPESFSLRVETTQEGEDRGAGSLGRSEHLAQVNRDFRHTHPSCR